MLGPLEQTIMDCLWDQPPRTVRQIHACLQSNRPIAYTTVMTIMTRLTEKNLLNRTKSGKAYIYTAKHSKRQAIRRLVHQIITSLTNQFGHEAVAAFTDELENLSHQDRQRLTNQLQNRSRK
jgi:predicted transcriptional regulator